MIVHEGELQFHFSGAISAIKFDEQDANQSTFHGLSHCMKAVDFIVEYEDYYLFIEIKDPPDSSRYATKADTNALIKVLVSKFRDSFLYQWCEGKLDKPIRYQCLVELDNAQTLYLMDALKRQLPIYGTPSRWKRKIASICSVTNQLRWNKTFHSMPVTRIKRG